MACCGSRRAQLNTRTSGESDQGNAQAPAPSPPPRPNAPAHAAFITLHYLRRDGLSLRGPRTGTVYHVSAASPELPVHPDDVAALLRTGLFTQTGG